MEHVCILSLETIRDDRLKSRVIVQVVWTFLFFLGCEEDVTIGNRAASDDD